MARTIRIFLSLVLFAGGLAVATGTFPADVDEAEAVGYGCTASTGATLHEFEYGGVKYCTERFNSTGSWTAPAWVTKVDVFVVGGGGAGANTCTDSLYAYGSLGAGGGGGGGVAKKLDYSVTPNTSYPLTVGSGGSQRSCLSGNDGGTSTFNSGYLTAYGGKGGNYANGGDSGTGSVNGQITQSVHAGGNDDYDASSPQQITGGGGGGAGSIGLTPVNYLVSYLVGTVVMDYSTTPVTTEYWSNIAQLLNAGSPYGGSGIWASEFGITNQSFGCGGGGGASISTSNAGQFFGEFRSVGSNDARCTGGKGAGFYVGPTGWNGSAADARSYIFDTRYPTYGPYAWDEDATSPTSNSGQGGGGGGGILASGAADDAGFSTRLHSGTGGADGTVLIRYVAPVPVNTTAPSIVDGTPGSVIVGEQLTLSTPTTVSAGVWTNPLPNSSLTFTGQWSRVSGSAVTPITGATQSTYTVQTADIGYNFVYTETASNGTASTSATSLATSPPVVGQPTFTAQSPPQVTPTGSAFSYTFAASGGNITYSLVNSDLPGNVTIGASTGVLSGTPTDIASYSYAVKATNAAGQATTSAKMLHVGRTSTPSTSATTQRSGIDFTENLSITLAQGATLGASVPIAVTVSAGPASRTLSGTLTRTTDENGEVTFSGLRLTGTAGTYTLSFDAGPEWPVATVTVTLTAGDPVALQIATQPVGGVQANQNLGTQPVVNIVDSAGNTITNDNSTVVTATLASGWPAASLVTASATATASAGVATFSNMKVTGGIGRFTLGFTSNPVYNPVTSSVFTILGVSQTITFGAIGNKTLGNPPFVVTASASSGLPLTFSSTTPSVCSPAAATTTSAIVSLHGGGTCTIQVDQGGDQVYSEAPSVSQSATVSTIAQTTPLTMQNATVEFGRSLTLTSSGGSGTGAVTYSPSGGAGSANCSISGDQLTHTSVGTCGVFASKLADSSYQSTQSAAVTITVVKARQSVEFTSTPPVSATVGATAYVATATASSGLAVSMSIATVSAAVCTSANLTSPMTVTFTGEGNCTLQATVSASTNYEAEDEPAVQTIVVGPAGGGGLQNQWISFAPLSNMSIGDANIVLSATTSADLPVSFSTTTTSVCTVSGRVLAVVGVGRCLVTATQAGDATFAPASPVTRAFTVSPTTPHAPGLRGVSGQAGAIRVSFTPPAFDGGSPILSYRVIATPTSGTPVVSDACTSSPCTIAGLATGTSYTVTMRARNAVGWGAESSASVAVTPTANPVAVQNVSVVAGNGTLAVSWDDPANFGGGSCQVFELRIRVAGGTWPVSAGATATCPVGSFQSMSVQNIFTQSTGTHTFSGLTPGTAYDVQIVTITSLLATATDTNTAVVSGIPVGPPNAPRQLSVIDSGAGQITLYWAAPLIDGGSSIIGYEVLVGSTSCGSVTIDPTSSAGTCVASGLTSQATYVITVRARNVFGLGASHTGSHTVAAHNAGTGTGSGGGGGGGGGTTSDDDDDDDDGENDGDDNDGGNGDGVPRPGGPDAPPLPGNDDDDDGFPDPWTPNPDPNNRPGIPCSGCVQVFPAPSGDGGPQPGVTSSPPGSRPGIIQVSTGTGPVVTIGGANSDGRPSTATSPNGGLIVGPGGNVPIVLTGLKPGSTVTVWLADQFSVSGVVGPDGTISLIASVPNDLPPGTYTGRVDMVDPSGQAQSILFGFEWVGRYGMLPVTGSDGVESLVIVLWMFVGGALIVAMSRRRHLL